MSKVICYPRCCSPLFYDDDCYYFEMFSTPKQKKTMWVIWDYNCLEN